jgi:hypothetical protein
VRDAFSNFHGLVTVFAVRVTVLGHHFVTVGFLVDVQVGQAVDDAFELYLGHEDRTVLYRYGILVGEEGAESGGVELERETLGVETSAGDAHVLLSGQTAGVSQFACAGFWVGQVLDVGSKPGHVLVCP